MVDPISTYFCRSSVRHGPLLLMYHSVTRGARTTEWPWAVSMRNFRNQLDFLKGEGWSTPTMAELAAEPAQWGGKTVVITLDDGYEDNLAACEELHKRNMKATLFMVSGAIGKEPAWHDDGCAVGRLLNQQELRQLKAAEIEIGSHTVNHARLTQIDDDQLIAELADSKSALQDVLGSEVTSFAYPYGEFDARAVAAVRNAGYRAACTTQSGWALRDGDPYQMRRLTIYNTDTTSSMARKLAFASNQVRWSGMATNALDRLCARLKI